MMKGPDDLDSDAADIQAMIDWKEEHSTTEQEQRDWNHDDEENLYNDE